MDIIHICHFQELYCARQKLKAKSQRTEIKPPSPRKLNTDGIVILIVDKLGLKSSQKCQGTLHIEKRHSHSR